MVRIIRLLVPAVIAMLTVGVLVTAAAPARAESVTVHDPTGDTQNNLGYDITSMRIRHKAKRISFELHQTQTPYWYEIRVDVPGPKPWSYRVTWAVYTPHKVFVQRRHADPETFVCVRKNADTSNHDKVLTFTLPRSCFGPPKAVKVKAIAWDDEFGWSDRTAWSEWVGVS